MSRKARAAERARRMSRAAQARLAPGERPRRRRRTLRDDPDRFALVLLHNLLDDGLSRYAAARLAMILTERFSWSPFERVDEQLIKLTAAHALAAIDLDNRAEALLDKTGALIRRIWQDRRHSRQAEDDAFWFAASTVLVRAAFDPRISSQPAMAQIVLEDLCALGWRDQLVTMRDRIVAAQRTNYPPVSEPLPQSVKAVQCRLRNSADLRSLGLPNFRIETRAEG